MRIRTANQAGRRKWLTLRQQEAAALKRALDRAEQRRELTQRLRALQLALHEGVVPLKPRRAI